MDQKLRRAQPADASAVRELTRAAYAKWVPVIGREPKPMTADYDLAVREHLIDLLYVDGQMAGLVEMIPQADHLLIENLAISPPCQGRRYGGRLMRHAEQVATSLGLPETRLYTNKLFAENVQFYCRRGYRVTHEEAFKAGIAVHMSKLLREDRSAPIDPMN